MSRAAWIAIAIAAALVTSPVWGFEVLYHAFLPADLPALPATTDATTLELDALWLETGERLQSSEITPLWAWNYFRLTRPGQAAQPGRRAVTALARGWSMRAVQPGVREHGLRRMLKGDGRECLAQPHCHGR